MNKITLIGRVGKDPEIRYMQSGDPVVTFSLATSESWRDKDSGERKERTEWHNIVIFNDGLCKIAQQYVHKGSRICVEGKLQSREYTDSDNVKRKRYEVVLQQYKGELILLDTKPKDDTSHQPDDISHEMDNDTPY